MSLGPLWSSLSWGGTSFSQILILLVSSFLFLSWTTEHPNLLFIYLFFPPETTTPFFTFWEALFQASESDYSLITLTFYLITIKYCFYPGWTHSLIHNNSPWEKRLFFLWSRDSLFLRMSKPSLKCQQTGCPENDTDFSSRGAAPLSNSSQAGTYSVNVFLTLVSAL